MAIIKNPITIVKQYTDTFKKYFVTVVDYDGTVLKEEELSEGSTFILPNPPTHTRLTFQEWSSPIDITNNSIIVPDQDVIIGPIYTPTSGNTEIDIELTKSTGLDVTLCIITTNCTIDWGDNTITNEDKSDFTHTYTQYGKYTIQIIPNNETASYSIRDYLFNQSNTTALYNQYCTEIRLSKQNLNIINNASFNYCVSLNAISIPKEWLNFNFRFLRCYNLKSFIFNQNAVNYDGTYFNECYGLQYIVMPKNITKLNQNFARNTSIEYLYIPDSVINLEQYSLNSTQLKRIKLPNNLTTIGQHALANNYRLEKLILPNTLTSIGYGSFTGLQIDELIFPNSITTFNNSVANTTHIRNIKLPENTALLALPNNTLQSCSHLSELYIPSNYRIINSYAINNCRNIKKIIFEGKIDNIGAAALPSSSNPNSCDIYDFTNCTGVPTLDGINNLQNIKKTCKIYVPDNLYDDWIIATNWVNYVDYIYKASEMED